MRHIPRISSGLKAVDVRQEPPPLIIGERLNTQGSRRAKEMVLADDFDGLVQLARKQVEDGAHCLDICVATTERSDEIDFMRILVKRLSAEIDAPLFIDSTDPNVINAALQQIPGRPVINSINLEGEGNRFHALAPLMAKYGVPAIAMCIGPEGMAKTSKEKVETALLLFETGKKYGLKPWQYIFDVLTFTLATGEEEYLDSAKATIEGIRLVKQAIPECFTVLGISNVSFGLAPNIRKIVNSVFLHHALFAGLDAVIVNAKDIIPYYDIDSEQRTIAEDLIFNRYPNALGKLITYFEGVSHGSDAPSKKAELDPSWSANIRCHFRIVHRLKEGIEFDVRESIAGRIYEKLDTGNAEPNKTIKDRLIANAPKELVHEAAVDTLNSVLLPAMKEVGDKFGAGQLILPFVLKSAECMKAAVVELEKYLIKREGVSKGKLVLCTVYGDVHDIGKNLVKTIFSNNGYSVYDLGKQVPLQRIFEKIKEVDADAVGLSALLVSTSKQMQYFVEQSRMNNMTIPVLCGGAAINSDYINRIAKEGGTYKPGVFYCKTAFEGLNVMNKLMSTGRTAYISAWQEKLQKWQAKQKSSSASIDLPRSAIKPLPAPMAPHIAKRVRLEIGQIDLRTVWPFLNKKSLFVLSWGFRGIGAKGLDIEAEKLFEVWKDRVIRERIFEPRIVYGYFKCHNRGNDLAVESADGAEVTFNFPRSSKEKNLCISDYFGENDIVAFQAVTVGDKVTKTIDKWNQDDKYTDAYYLHGLAVETAEALAEWTNLLIKTELNLAKGGLRYSWGYPSCPDISQHHLVWTLLDPTPSGMSLTDAGQIIPDQSTAAIVVHHPDAEYFVL
ncbi:dihydropteroate synthase [Nitrososphaera sp. AFS]|jgi:5-methyltetrahydrofolate--homocysteine methyltransferase|uniref:dihydropteroate synthase n=1 Tax=Nitrososphaera sp. AFS TaxID=2301191 RepID=UPI001392296B|nr:dihydropteroate synthase [Nitrososphaera sp. AFS]NAL77803.1 methionine synthase [Nitrososphaera sp. AFS]